MNSFRYSPPDPRSAERGSEFDAFLRCYEPTFCAEFLRTYRHAIGSVRPAADIARDAKTLYHAMFLAREGADAANTVRASFRLLADATDQAETILKRTWMIMATTFIDHRRARGGSAEDVGILQTMIARYSALLNDVCRDTSRSVALEIPEIDIGTDYYRKTVCGFRQYLRDALDDELRQGLCVFTCFRGVPLDSPATVVAVNDDGVTLQVSPAQVAVLSKIGLALVESPVHGTAYRAYSSNVDAAACEVTFSQFIRYDQPFDRRQHRRIRPTHPLPVTMRKASLEFAGWLCDVSALAAAVQFRSIDPDNLRAGDPVELEFGLPKVAGTGGSSLSLPGRVRSIYFNEANDRRSVRVVVQMPGSAKLFAKISEHVVVRNHSALGKGPADDSQPVAC